jgi:hypothetical protein
MTGDVKVKEVQNFWGPTIQRKAKIIIIIIIIINFNISQNSIIGITTRIRTENPRNYNYFLQGQAFMILPKYSIQYTGMEGSFPVSKIYGVRNSPLPFIKCPA